MYGLRMSVLNFEFPGTLFKYRGGFLHMAMGRTGVTKSKPHAGILECFSYKWYGLARRPKYQTSCMWNNFTSKDYFNNKIT